jgi:hypothetical protein
MAKLNLGRPPGPDGLVAGKSHLLIGKAANLARDQIRRARKALDQVFGFLPRVFGHGRENSWSGGALS